MELGYNNINRKYSGAFSTLEGELLNEDDNFKSVEELKKEKKISPPKE